jgi:uncharacterized SAM-binding protein YcdF (DUF218 family)
MFVLSKFAIAIISPLGSALLGGLLAMVAGLSGFRRLALALGVLSLAWLLAWSLPVTSYAIRGYLESHHPATDASAIVVLGGGTAPLRYGSSYPDLGPASDREWHGARLYQVDKAPLIILNGGHDPQFSATSSAESMRRFIRALGVPDSDIVLEEESRNTTQNADFTGDIPAATDHEVVPLPGWRKWLPDTAALDGSSRAIKEIVGRLVGR